MSSTRIFSLPERLLPGSLPDDTELFVIGDVHGRADQLAMILEAIRYTPRSADRRILIFLGDLIDRGPKSLRAIQLALNAESLSSVDEAHILPGNHELALLDVLNGGDHRLWIVNGGGSLLAEVHPDAPSLSFSEARDHLASAIPEAFKEAIKTAPSHMRLGDLLMVHAGLDPNADPAEHLARNRPLSDLHWAAIRHEFLCFTGGWDHNEGGYFRGATVVVHGHTPAVREDLFQNIEAMREMDGIEEYRSICLDASAATRPQVGWAHFFNRDSRTFTRIHTAVGKP